VKLVTVTIPPGQDVTLTPGEVIRYCDDQGTDCDAEVIDVRLDGGLLLAVLAINETLVTDIRRCDRPRAPCNAGAAPAPYPLVRTARPPTHR